MLTVQGLTSFTAFLLYGLIKTSFQKESPPKSPSTVFDCELSECHSTADSRKTSSSCATALISNPALSDLKGIRGKVLRASLFFRGYFTVLCITARERSSTKTEEPWNYLLKKHVITARITSFLRY